MSIVFNNKPSKVTRFGKVLYELKIIRKSLGLNHRSFHKTRKAALDQRNAIEREVNQKDYKPLRKNSKSMTYNDVLLEVVDPKNNIENYLLLSQNKNSAYQYYRKLRLLGKSGLSKEIFRKISANMLKNKLDEITKQRNLSNSTVNKYIESLDRLFRYAVKESIITHNITKELQRNYRQGESYRYLKSEEYEKIIIAAEEIAFEETKGKAVPYYEKGRFIKIQKAHIWTFMPLYLMFLWHTGARAGSLLHLTWDNVSFVKDNPYIGARIYLAKTKGDVKRGIVTIPPDVAIKLRRYKLKFGDRSDLVFPPYGNNKSWSRLKALRYINKRAGIELDEAGRGIVYHSFRHGWATESLKAGATLAELKDAGLWTNTQQPNRYLHYSEDNVYTLAEKRHHKKESGQS